MTLVHWVDLSPADPGDRAPSVVERIRHEWLQRDAVQHGPSFLTPRYDAFTLADRRGRMHARLAPPASEVPDPSRAYVVLLDGPEGTPPVPVTTADPAARPDAPNAPSTALRAAVMREGIAA